MPGIKPGPRVRFSIPWHRANNVYENTINFINKTNAINKIRNPLSNSCYNPVLPYCSISNSRLADILHSLQ